MPPAKFSALSGPLEGRTLLLEAEELTLGRHASNRLVIRDPAVSRHHARLTRDEGGFLLRDLDSRHGTLVNGRPVERHRLTHGDLVALGESSFLFLEHPAETESTGPVRFDDTTLHRDTTQTLQVGEGHYFRPEGVLEALSPGSDRDPVLAVLLRAGSELGHLRSFDELADHLLRLLLEVIPAERAVLLLGERLGDGYEQAFALDAYGERLESMEVSQTVALRVLRQKIALFSNDVLHEEDLRGSESLRSARVGALLCVPLVVAQATARGRNPRVPSGPESGTPEFHCLGVIYLDDRRDGAQFSDAALELATALAGMGAPTVANLRHLTWVEGERRRLQADSLDHEMVGESEAIQQTLQVITRVARTDSTVLIRGESGTGKELAARALHRAGDRCDGPFVAINCATLGGDLLESELFGHEKGAFTGAEARKIGKLELAHVGTLFLDEVGELPVTTQAKLLRVLQEREFERVGGTRRIEVDVRIVAATNRDLEAAMEAGTFREDLYYRLDVISITLPPLRQRRGDIPLLAGHFAALHAVRLKRSVPSFSAAARDLLERHDWPGNVRELSNAIERALVLCTDGGVRPEDLPEALLEHSSETEENAVAAGWTYHDALRQTKRQLIKNAVRESQGNITQAAKALDLHPNYLHRLIKNLDLRSHLL